MTEPSDRPAALDPQGWRAWCQSRVGGVRPEQSQRGPGLQGGRSRYGREGRRCRQSPSPAARATARGDRLGRDLRWDRSNRE